METFFADDKFGSVIEDLLNRSLVRTNNPLESQILWTNLRNVDFDDITCAEKMINHFSRSHHFSNKAFLAYHLFTNGKLTSTMPTTWSPAYADIVDLLEILIPHEFMWLMSDGANETNDSTRYQKLLQLRRIVEKVRDFDTYFVKGSTALQTSSLLLNTIIKDKDFSESNISSIIQQLSPFVPMDTSNIWIIKPIGLSCGEKITVVQGFSNCINTIQSFEKLKCIVQKYIERPLLVRDQVKFDIRQWVLVTSLDPLIIYGFSECYLRLSSRPFSIDINQLQNNFIHLTNHAIQKMATNNDETNDHHDDNDANDANNECNTMMNQSEFIEELSERFNGQGERIFTEVLLPKMKELSIAAIVSVSDRLERIGNSFEWLGMDFMITDNNNELDVKLLEVNTSPDISHSTSITTRLVQYGVHDLFDLLLDHRIDTPTSPHWTLWYHSNHNESQERFSRIQQGRRKQSVAKLRSDCLPKQTNLFNEIVTILLEEINKTQENDNENDDDCDEI